mgnify:CR=1 FL=1
MGLLIVILLLIIIWLLGGGPILLVLGGVLGLFLLMGLGMLVILLPIVGVQWCWEQWRRGRDPK